VADSIGRCNGLAEHLSRRLEAESLSRPLVQLSIDPDSLDALVRLYHLTRAERDVLRRIAEGSTAGEIARDLDVAITTVRTHLQNLLRKTGTRRQADLVRLASAFAVRTASRFVARSVPAVSASVPSG
jgi:DNA-binding CsgD family transcriptional regulator